MHQPGGASHETVNITLNTNDWTTNRTRCYKMGGLVFLNVYVQGTPANNRVIATGCPLTASNVINSAGSPPSVITLDTTGNCYISSAGTGTYIGATLIYEESA